MSMLSRELALLLASTCFIFSFVFKYIVLGAELIYISRDIIMFFAIYLLSKFLLYFVDKIIINHRKIM